MSADNYYIIRKHPLGGFAAVMGFMSDDTEPTASELYPQYATVEDALHTAMADYAEYGVSVHQECEWR